MSLRNLITDIAGIRVGNAEDPRLASGVTAIVFDEPAVAAVDVRGGAPGTRETDLLEPHRTVERIDAVVLSGGSAFGLDAALGGAGLLRETGRGFAIGDIRIPIVCGAVLFDMLNGGDKNWGRFPPYRDLGYAAAAAAGATFALGTAGAGFGATTVNLKGGLGSASAVTRDGHMVGALVAVNACGSVNVGRDPHFWAAPFELGSEFGGLGFPGNGFARSTDPARQGPAGREHHHRHRRDRRHVEQGADQGACGDRAGRFRPRDLSRRIRRSTATPCSRRRPAAARSPIRSTSSPSSATVAANALARAVARAVFEAKALPGGIPSWHDCHSGRLLHR